MKMRFKFFRCFTFGIGFMIFTWLITMGLYNHLNRTEQDRLRSNNEIPRARLKPRKAVQDYNGVANVVQDLDRGDNEVLQFDKSHDQFGEDRGDLIKNGARKDAIETVDLVELGKVRSPEDQMVRDKGYRKYAFNALISDRLSFTRTIPDVRNRLCKTRTYPEDLPRASVIICFYNEAYSALLRTFHTVLARSPEMLIKEIILVDDYSSEEETREKLESYIEAYPKISIIRTKKREGLIRARSLGAAHATGEVIVFLDSHCEVNKEWLEPLLARIKEDRRNVVVPIIDIINMDTFQYEASPLVRGGFTWGLHYRWDQVPQEMLKPYSNIANPIASPTMAGGLFAMDRTYFMELGEYDKGMDTWGAENLELSFRIWMCGGRLEIIPCSRVGHIFRKVRPYGDPAGQNSMMKNSIRLAKVWMDDYIKYFYQTRPSALQFQGGNITERVELRKKLKCQSFEWYLKNIYPQQTLPSPQKVQASGKKQKFYKPVFKRSLLLKLHNTELCIQSSETYYSKRALLNLKPCNENERGQTWFETEDNSLVLGKMLCLDADTKEENPFPRIMKCYGKRGPQEWNWKGMMLFNPSLGKCVAATKLKDGAYIEMRTCDRYDALMQIDQVSGFHF